MNEAAYQAGVLQALIKIAQRMPSIEQMKANVSRQHAAGTAPDPMQGPAQRKVPMNIPAMLPTAWNSVTSQAPVAPAAPAAPAKAPGPSPYGSEAYEKGWSPSGSVATHNARLQRALNY